MMQRLLQALCGAVLLTAFLQPVRAAGGSSKESLVVVATRYLQAEGVSHAHLYLYREDGTFLRQLTRSEKGQDQQPLFSPDGKEIVFIRTADGNEKKSNPGASFQEPSSSEYWRVETRGGGLKRLAALPEWYRLATNAVHFTAVTPKDWPTNTPVPGVPEKGWDRNFSNPPTQEQIASLPVTKVTSPDGLYELTLKMGPEDVGCNGPGNGKLYELNKLKTGKNWRLGELPGFVGLTDLLHDSTNPTQLFLQQGDLNVVFFDLHMGSTDGDWLFALDLKQPGLHSLICPSVPAPPPPGKALFGTGTGGNGLPIPLSGEPCFLAMVSERYQPIPGSSKTANISYLARFDAALKGTPYVNLRTAPLFYGASVYRPTKSPVVLKIGEKIGGD